MLSHSKAICEDAQDDAGKVWLSLSCVNFYLFLPCWHAPSPLCVIQELIAINRMLCERLKAELGKMKSQEHLEEVSVPPEKSPKKARCVFLAVCACIEVFIEKKLKASKIFRRIENGVELGLDALVIDGFYKPDNGRIFSTQKFAAVPWASSGNQWPEVCVLFASASNTSFLPPPPLSLSHPSPLFLPPPPPLSLSLSLSLARQQVTRQRLGQSFSTFSNFWKCLRPTVWATYVAPFHCSTLSCYFD